MKITKLPSGSYRIQPYVNGKRKSITFDHKPTQREINQILGELEEKKIKCISDMTFADAAESYILSKANVLSPETIIGYRSIVRRLSDEFCCLRISEINNFIVQKEINEYSAGRSPKTVRNASGFISAVMKMFVPDVSINVKLPQKIKTNDYLPTEEDVKRILEYFRETEMFIPLSLAVMGLRRSEVLALTVDDITQDETGRYMININKAMVRSEDAHGWTVKTTKTVESTREIYLPKELAEMIIEQGYVYKGDPHKIYKHLSKAEKELGIPHFSLHKLRHYFAAKMSELVSDATVMKLGGWQTDSIMKQVYRYSLDQNTADAIVSLF